MIKTKKNGRYWKPQIKILEEFRNIKSSFLTEVKSFKNKCLQSCVKHSPSDSREFDE